MRNVVAAVLLAVCLTGCSDSEEVPVPAPPPSSASGVMPADGTGISLSAPAVEAPPPVAPPAPGSAAPASIGSKDEYNGEVVMRDDDGNRLNGEALLKRAMMQHVEGKGHPYPERIEELVEKGTLKSLPPAPSGQKWAIDPATRQIVLK